jgi:predicted nucleotidyltransferase
MEDSRNFNWVGLLRRLKDHGVEFVVIGGVAASLRGSPVVTYDVDVCAPMAEPNLTKILTALRDLRPRFRFRPDKMPVPQDPARLHGIKNLNLDTDWGTIDLLGELPNIGSFEDLADKTSLMDLGGFTCRVLDLETLLAAKKAAGREKDLPNILQLKAIQRLQKQQPGLFDPPD